MFGLITYPEITPLIRRGQGVPEVRAAEEDEEVPELQDVGREGRRLQRDALPVRGRSTESSR